MTSILDKHDFIVCLLVILGDGIMPYFLDPTLTRFPLVFMANWFQKVLSLSLKFPDQWMYKASL